MKLKVLVLSFLVIFARANSSKNLTAVTIIHINDFHARFEEINPDGTACRDAKKCVGGYARLVTVVSELLHKYRNQHVLYLNAGDNFQGTPWYNVFRWNVTKHFLNLLPPDAMTLGNHEFDHGINGLIPFVENINSHIVLANIDERGRETLKDKVSGAVIINKQGVRIGIIGVIFQKVPEASLTENLTFYDEVETVRLYSEHLKTKGVNVIIVISHSGLTVDTKIAQEAGPLVDAIIGGHSHTYMYNGTDPKSPDKPKETYPLVVTQKNGHQVLVVQAGHLSKYVGLLTIYFDEFGEPRKWEGNPIYLEHDIKPDENVLNNLKPWKVELDKTVKEKVGSSEIKLDDVICRYEECLLGNMVADSMVDHFKGIKDLNGNPLCTVAMVNTGGIRVPLPQGTITYGDALSCLPFGNRLEMITVPGKVIRDALELSVAEHETDYFFRFFFQVAGLQITFDPKKPVNSRVVELKILQSQNKKEQYVDVENSKNYNIILNTFIAKGGDGFSMFPQFKTNPRIGSPDIDAFIEYLKKISPVNIKPQGRIKVLKD